jgi:hypothetical protein
MIVCKGIGVGLKRKSKKRRSKYTQTLAIPHPTYIAYFDGACDTERMRELVPTSLGTRLVHAKVTPEHYPPVQNFSLMVSKTAVSGGIKLESTGVLALH